jgi:N4-gp56 family major capsid protein
MTMQTYTLNAGRLEKFKGAILAHAVPMEVLGRAGRQVQMPKNNSKNYVARRWLPYGATSADKNTINRFFQDGNSTDRATAIANAHLVTEGITPTPDSMTPVDTTVVMQQYSCLYGFTDQTFDMYEDDIPKEMIAQVGERVTFVNEMIIYGALKACTNAYYGGTGTTVATVNGALSLGLIRKIVQNLQANHAKYVTNVLKASGDFGTDPVAAGFLVYCHTDLEPDIRDLPGFTPTELYASGTAMANEVGKCERFRFITSPDLPSIQNGGAAIGATNLYSTTGTNLDVYPFIVCAQDAWSQIALRGSASVDPTYLPPGQKSKSDPHGQRGYAGTIWYKAIMIENNGWMAVGNVGRKNLPV